MYAGVCGAMVCANLGFTVHTLCHYCYRCRQQGLKAFGGGLKSCKSTSGYEQIYSVVPVSPPYSHLGTVSSSHGL